MRTDLEKGRPTTALSRRHERMLDQVFGGKRPTRIEGGLRLIASRIQEPSAQSQPGEIGWSAQRGDRLSPERREKKLDISANIEGLLLLRACLVGLPMPAYHGGMRRRGPQ